MFISSFFNIANYGNGPGFGYNNNNYGMPYPPNGYPAQGGNLYPPTNPPNFDQMAFVQQQVNYLFFFYFLNSILIFCFAVGTMFE